MKHVCNEVPSDYEISFVWGQWDIYKVEKNYDTCTFKCIPLIYDIVYCPYCGKSLEEERW